MPNGSLFTAINQVRETELLWLLKKVKGRTALIEINALEEFDKVWKEDATRNKVVILKIYYSFCGACIDSQPKFVKAANERSDDMVFCQLEIEDVNGAGERFNVKFLPTFIAFKDGKEIGRYVGAKNDGLTLFLNRASADNDANENLTSA